MDAFPEELHCLSPLHADPTQHALFLELLPDPVVHDPPSTLHGLLEDALLPVLPGGAKRGRTSASGFASEPEAGGLCTLKLADKMVQNCRLCVSESDSALVVLRGNRMKPQRTQTND